MFRVGVALCSVLLVVSCATMGPKTIPRDQFEYGNSIAGSAREQILKNIVGLRYVEAPVFVDVASVINQYALEGEIAAGLGANTSVSGGDTVTLGGAGRWADRPTITYTPVTGRKFASSLLTPLPPESLFALVQGGWPSELILRMTVHSINGIENAWTGPARRKQADPAFIELLRVWGRLRDARVLGLSRAGTGRENETTHHIVVYLNDERMTPELRRDSEFFYETLGLDPSAKEVKLSYGLIPNEPNEIAVLTSSILELMNDLAWRIDVPDSHVEEGRTGATFVTSESGLLPLIRVRQSAERPENAFVSVENREHWFYIDDRDMLSKRTFALVQILLSLTDTGDTARGPILSLTN